MTDPITPTTYTTVHRRPERARYDRDLVHAILDEGLIAHVGITWEDRPVVIPMAFARVGDTVYLHGSPASRLLRELGSGVDVCVTVTLLDGLVLARSAFHHSMNYRSVVVFGRAVEITEPAQKSQAFDALVDHIVPGRRGVLRETTPRELRATRLLAMRIDEASAKVRVGPPVDDEEDYEMSIWAGVLPLSLQPQEPIDDPRAPADATVPDHVSGYRRGVTA